MTKAQRNVTAAVGLVAGIVADQIIDPHVGLMGHMGMLVAGGVPVVFLLERYFRSKNLKRNPPPSSPTA